MSDLYFSFRFYLPLEELNNGAAIVALLDSGPRDSWADKFTPDVIINCQWTGGDSDWGEPDDIICELFVEGIDVFNDLTGPITREIYREAWSYFRANRTVIESRCGVDGL